MMLFVTANAEPTKLPLTSIRDEPTIIVKRAAIVVPLISIITTIDGDAIFFNKYGAYFY